MHAGAADPTLSSCYSEHLAFLSPPLLQSHAEGTDRFLLDGFPRTAQQAAALDAIADVKLAVNLGLREEVRATGLQGVGSEC